jgi:hypothetical protein
MSDTCAAYLEAQTEFQFKSKETEDVHCQIRDANAEVDEVARLVVVLSVGQYTRRRGARHGCRMNSEGGGNEQAHEGR